MKVLATIGFLPFGAKHLIRNMYLYGMKASPRRKWIGMLCVFVAIFSATRLDAQYRDGAAERTVFIEDEILRLVPPAAGLGLGLLGVEATHPFKERLAATATSGIFVVGSVYALKHFVDRERPLGDRMDSFPSGHAAVAFWGAEIVREEYGWGWGLGAYAVAGTVAALRLYHEQHWATDVLAGAAIGVLGARIGYWLLPWERRLFGWDQTPSQTLIHPTYSPHAGALQLTFSKTF